MTIFCIAFCESYLLWVGASTCGRADSLDGRSRDAIFPSRDLNIPVSSGTRASVWSWNINYNPAFLVVIFFKSDEWYINRKWYVCQSKPSSEATLIKKKRKLSSYIRKFRRDRLQNHTWQTASSQMVNYLHISSYFRKPFLIYDFALDPIWISLYFRKTFFSFFQCTFLVYLVGSPMGSKLLGGINWYPVLLGYSPLHSINTAFM
jgi:hypothetical protein